MQGATQPVNANWLNAAGGRKQLQSSFPNTLTNRSNRTIRKIENGELNPAGKPRRIFSSMYRTRTMMGSGGLCTRHDISRFIRPTSTTMLVVFFVVINKLTSVDRTRSLRNPSGRR